MRAEAIRSLQSIPGVGKSIAEDLWNIGIKSPGGLKGKDPDSLYRKLCEYEGRHIDRCMLYILRCAVYYASRTHHDAELLKWWNWSDKNLRTR